MSENTWWTEDPQPETEKADEWWTPQDEQPPAE